MSVSPVEVSKKRKSSAAGSKKDKKPKEENRDPSKYLQLWVDGNKPFGDTYFMQTPPQAFESFLLEKRFRKADASYIASQYADRCWESARVYRKRQLQEYADAYANWTQKVKKEIEVQIDIKRGLKDSHFFVTTRAEEHGNRNCAWKVAPTSASKIKITDEDYYAHSYDDLVTAIVNIKTRSPARKIWVYVVPKVSGPARTIERVEIRPHRGFSYSEPSLDADTAAELAKDGAVMPPLAPLDELPFESRLV